MGPWHGKAAESQYNPIIPKLEQLKRDLTEYSVSSLLGSLSYMAKSFQSGRDHAEHRRTPEPAIANEMVLNTSVKIISADCGTWI